mmetsp:Transcript_45747/g.108952  ORF Transcript_45747/g.108952 Transcript_45747/m.108952 type:complete len:203 (-) Transcript_45747:1235-1843(-)
MQPLSANHAFSFSAPTRKPGKPAFFCFLGALSCGRPGAGYSSKFFLPLPLPLPRPLPAGTFAFLGAACLLGRSSVCQSAKSFTSASASPSPLGSVHSASSPSRTNRPCLRHLAADWRRLKSARSYTRMAAKTATDLASGRKTSRVRLMSLSNTNLACPFKAALVRGTCFKDLAVRLAASMAAASLAICAGLCSAPGEGCSGT